MKARNSAANVDIYTDPVGLSQPKFSKPNIATASNEQSSTRPVSKAAHERDFTKFTVTAGLLLLGAYVISDN